MWVKSHGMLRKIPGKGSEISELINEELQQSHIPKSIVIRFIMHTGLLNSYISKKVGLKRSLKKILNGSSKIGKLGTLIHVIQLDRATECNSYRKKTVTI